jgi:hypothetical protein
MIPKEDSTAIHSKKIKKFEFFSHFSLHFSIRGCLFHIYGSKGYNPVGDHNP